MLAAILAFLHCETWLTAVTDALPAQPYMDEEFHLRQTQAYLAGNWTQWDPKITTPPGLYAAGVAWHAAVEAVLTAAGVDPLPQPLTTLRSLNAALYAPLVLLLAELLVHPRVAVSLLGRVAPPRPAGGLNSELTALSIGSLPILFFFSGLYYTDVASLLSLLGLARLLHAERGWAVDAGRAACSVWALSLRQTNVVWVGVLYGLVVFDACAVVSVADLLRKLPRCVAETLLRHSFLPALLCSAGALTAWNGSIVLGDRSNHAAAFHPTQMVYLTALAACFYPFACLRALHAGAVALPARAVVGAAAWAAFAAWCLRHHCEAHPFTLADNRHYTFYLWRRLHMDAPGAPYVKYAALVPLSTAGAAAAAHALRRVRPAVALLLVLGTAATLVPSPLYEPRYYIVPLALLAVVGNVADASELTSVDEAESWASLTPIVLHILLHCAVNVVTMYIFLDEKYQFDYADGSVGRIMW